MDVIEKEEKREEKEETEKEEEKEEMVNDHPDRLKSSL